MYTVCLKVESISCSRLGFITLLTRLFEETGGMKPRALLPFWLNHATTLT